MTQPKYQFGDTLLIPLDVNNPESGYKTELHVEATVASISYDPRNGSCGAPYYFYGMYIHGCTKTIGIKEYQILAKIK